MGLVGYEEIEDGVFNAMPLFATIDADLHLEWVTDHGRFNLYLGGNEPEWSVHRADGTSYAGQLTEPAMLIELRAVLGIAANTNPDEVKP